MNKTAIKAAIYAAVAVPCRWKNDPRAMVSPTVQAEAILQVTNIKSLGQDEPRDDYTDVDNVTTKIAGNRTFTVSVRIEAYAGTEAWQYASNLVTRIQRPSVVALLNDEEIAIVGTGPILELPAFYDNRVVSAANVDLLLSCAINDAYTSEEDTQTWIETTEEPVGTIEY